MDLYLLEYSDQDAGNFKELGWYSNIIPDFNTIFSNSLEELGDGSVPSGSQHIPNFDHHQQPMDPNEFEATQ